MRAAHSLIPARFLATLAHLCVLITLLWETPVCVNHCLEPKSLEVNYRPVNKLFVTSFAVDIGIVLFEMVSFLSGMTMFSLYVSVISITAHVSGVLCLTYFVINRWLCATYWLIIVCSSILPCVCDNVTAIIYILYAR